MREIKAHVKPERVEAVVVALHDAGVSHLTVTHVRSFGSGVDPDERRMSLEVGEWYTEKAKIEFVCAAPDVETLVGIVVGAGRTGDPGDGIVFISDVGRMVDIGSGKEGREALP